MGVSTSLRIHLRQETFAVVRLAADAKLPSWSTAGRLWSIARSEDELSIVCEEHLIPAGHEPVERPWRALQLAGPIPFGLTGILASVLTPLASAGIPIFAFSTYDTDYVLVKSPDLSAARATLTAAGHVIL